LSLRCKAMFGPRDVWPVDCGPADIYGSDVIGISSCVPMYVNRMVEVDQTYLDLGEDGNVATERPLTDETVVNNSASPTGS